MNLEDLSRSLSLCVFKSSAGLSPRMFGDVLISMRHAAVVAGLALGLMSTAAQAFYVVDIDQVGADVVATGMGSININALTFVGRGGADSNLDASRALIGLGGDDPANTPADVYRGATGPRSFGSGGARADTIEGNLFDFRGSDGSFFRPRGYNGGDLGVSSSTFDNVTLAELGLVSGSYTYMFTNGESADSLTINIASVSAVPLPASAPMFGAALLALGAVGYGVKRKKAAATA